MLRQIGMLLESVSFKQHIIISIVIRLALILYGEIHDQISEIPYTDIDYKVVTDGARHMLQGDSPYQRHTYRYSPLLAFILTPNIFFHKCWGKLLFSLFDIFVGILIGKIVLNELQQTFFEAIVKLFKDEQCLTVKRNIEIPEKYKSWSKYAACAWLYNPLTMIIATRGNGDSISSLLVLSTVYFLQAPYDGTFKYFLAGIFHGLAIHFRIYPIILSLSFYLNLSNIRAINFRTFFNGILSPNRKQVLLVLGTVFGALHLTLLFYYLYGYIYIQEAYLYHLTRKDIRHNFSMYFLMQYLNSTESIATSKFLEKLIILLPQIILQIYIAVKFSLHRKTLSFCIFMQIFLLVTYNSVITSQYFVWFLSLLPLCLKNLRKISLRLAISYFMIWILAQGLWLLPAYLLEFKGWNTYNLIGLQSLCYFSVNVFLLQRILFNFDILADVRIVQRAYYDNKKAK